MMSYVALSSQTNSVGWIPIIMFLIGIILIGLINWDIDRSNKKRKNKMKTLIILQLLAGFILAMCGLIVMIHAHMWAGLGVFLAGIYGVLRATHRINVCN